MALVVAFACGWVGPVGTPYTTQPEIQIPEQNVVLAIIRAVSKAQGLYATGSLRVGHLESAATPDHEPWSEDEDLGWTCLPVTHQRYADSY